MLAGKADFIHMSGVKPYVFPTDLFHPLSPMFHLSTRTQHNSPLFFVCVCFMPEGQVCLSYWRKKENCCRGVRNSTEHQGTERQWSFYFIFFWKVVSLCQVKEEKGQGERNNVEVSTLFISLKWQSCAFLQLSSFFHPIQYTLSPPPPQLSGISEAAHANLMQLLCPFSCISSPNHTYMSCCRPLFLSLLAFDLSIPIMFLWPRFIVL